MSKAAAGLLSSCQIDIQEGDRSAQTVALVARLGFLCSSLDLDVDGRPFFLISLDLVQAGGFGRLVDPQDLFQILRAAGRSDVPNIPEEHRRLFWSTLLDAPIKGIRTLAAQNLLRLNPVSALVELPRYFSADINRYVFVHDLVQRLGADLLVKIAAAALGEDWLLRLRDALSDVGYPVIAEELEAKRIALMPGREGLGWRLDAIHGALGDTDDRSDPHPILVSAVNRPAVFGGLYLATRSTTVRRFMSRGGVVVHDDYVDRMARARTDLRLPSLMEA